MSQHFRIAGGMDLAAAFRADRARLDQALAHAARTLLLVPPECDVAAIRAEDGATLVTHSPWHHLYARERLRVPAARANMIPPGVDAELFSPAAAPRDERLVVLAWTGGADRALAAALDLRRDARVAVIAPAERLAEARAALAGMESIEAPDAPARAELLRRAAAVAIPLAARESGAGTHALLEAMACGAPVVATRTWGIEHLLVPGLEGLFVGVGDAGGFRDALRQLLGAPERGAALGANARAKVAASLTLEHWYARVARIAAAPASDVPEYYLVAAHNRPGTMAP